MICASANSRQLYQFIAVKMRENEVWKTAPEREFDNAVEAMEKLVMNRVHHQWVSLAPSAASLRPRLTVSLRQDLRACSFQLCQGVNANR